MLSQTFRLLVLCIVLYKCANCFQEVNVLRARHGEHCNKTVRCDTSSFLTCANSVCECQKKDSMFYDPVIKSCLVLVGEKCKFQLIKGKESSEDMQYYRGRVLEEQLDCVQNAWCNRSGVCMCSDDYVELNNGTCISKRILGESCTSDRECRQDQFMTCVDGQCGCNETFATYNVLIRQCVGKAEKPCIGSSAGCVYNAECIDESASYLGFTKRRMRQSVQICGCNSGFVSDSSGFCRVGLGGQCSNSKPCANEFKCKDSQCVCQYENAQLALLRSQTCLSLVGGPCNETVVLNDPIDIALSSNDSTTATTNTSIYQQQTFKCVDNAYCALTNNGSVYECQCNEGFTPNSDGSCDLAYGSDCNGNPNYVNNDDPDYGVTERTLWGQGLSCDRTIPLFCINGQCQCESFLYEYNSQFGTCLGKFGAQCQIGMSKGLNSNNNSTTINYGTFNGCIIGAECVPSKHVRAPYGKCVCSSGFTVASNRTCVHI